MRISPVNNTSFGKLRISNDTNTKQALSSLISSKEKMAVFQDSFKKLDEESGDTDVELKIKHLESEAVDQYNLSLNEGDPDWKDTVVKLVEKGWASPIQNIKEGFNELTDACSAKIDSFGNKVEETDIDEFFKEFGIESDNGRNIVIANDSDTREMFRDILKGKRQLTTLTEGLREIEEESCGHKLVIRLGEKWDPYRFMIYAEEPGASPHGVPFYANSFTNHRSNEEAKTVTEELKKLCLNMVDKIERAAYKPDIDALIASYQ